MDWSSVEVSEAEFNKKPEYRTKLHFFSVDNTLDCFSPEIEGKLKAQAIKWNLPRKDLWVSYEQDKANNRVKVRVEGVWAKL